MTASVTILEPNLLTEKGGVVGLQQTYKDDCDLGSHDFWSIEQESVYVRQIYICKGREQ